jgi:hypothetical protein
MSIWAKPLPSKLFLSSQIPIHPSVQPQRNYGLQRLRLAFCFKAMYLIKLWLTCQPINLFNNQTEDTLCVIQFLILSSFWRYLPRVRLNPLPTKSQSIIPPIPWLRHPFISRRLTPYRDNPQNLLPWKNTGSMTMGQLVWK